MPKLKKCIIILTIILAIIIVIVGIVYINRDRIIYGPRPDEQLPEEIYNYESTIKKVSVRNNYYGVESCVNKFYMYYSSIFKKGEEQTSSMTKAVYNMLDEEYISYKNITLDNLVTKLPKIEKRSISINNMYESEKDKKMSTFFVEGHFINTSTGETQPFLIMLKVDMSNRTFTVLLEDYIDKKYGNIQEGMDIKVNYPESIEANGYNKYNYEIIDDKTYITDVFKSFRDNLIYNKQIAYDSLNEEYKNKRFPTFKNFEQYIKNNIRKILAMKLSNYKKVNDDGNVRYICSDTNGNYYIIDEISTRNCTFILDTYTIDLPDFIEKYESSDKNTKVALNIEKIKEAINVKDFEYVYNKTDDTFKNNNFGSFEAFKNYLETNLFEENIFEYKNVESKGSVYVATIVVKSNTSASSKEMEVMMSLDEDSTNYKISFNFGE